MAMRFLALTALAAVGLVPHVVACAEARPADAAVAPAAGAEARFVETLDIEVPYGSKPGTFGFVAPGEDREALGPNAIDVRADGAILVSDPVRRVVFAVRVDSAGRPTIEAVGPLDLRPTAAPNGASAFARAVKTSAEGGEIVFLDGGEEHRVAVSAGGPLASLRLVGVDRAGRAFVLMERFRRLGGTEVDREVLVIERTGALVARTDLPEPPLVHPLTELRVTPDGALYRLAAGATSVRIVRLEVR